MAYKYYLQLTSTLKELQVPDFAATLACNNKGIVDLIYNHRISNKSKHIDMAYYHFRDSVNKGKLVVIHIASKQNLADIYTKGMPEPCFTYLNNTIISLKLY